MELTYTAKEKTKKTYRHYSISSKINAPEAADKKKTDFFYIGRKTSSIDTLIKSFETGYAAENVENAKFILNRLTSQNNSVPGVFIVDAGIERKEIAEIFHFVSNITDMSGIPFIIDAAHTSNTELDSLRKLEFVDEILFLNDYNSQKLFSKINFLKKIKQKAASIAHLKSSIETSVHSVAGPKSFFKRGFDITVSSLLLLVSSPILLLIAAAIKLESRGPVFYVAKRAGRGYRIFDFYKFRTMYTGADSKVKEYMHMNQYASDSTSGAPVFFKINNDPRITKVGLFLRKTSLDELPQFLNVLKGDMSMVGNRPLPLYEAATLTTDEWARRFMAPAGITGLWQIKKRGQDEMSVEERLTLDIDYAEKYNFMYDLWIMANTPSALIQKTNA
jgi:lipopolysaccharide/colanic/teichoic acid biosynthesis glycosyltransferase